MIQAIDTLLFYFIYILYYNFLRILDLHIYSESLSIEFLYILVPTLFGIVLSMVDIYNKHKTTFFMVLSSAAGLFYLVLSGVGALLFTQTMKAIGVSMVNNHENLNCILMSLIGAGLFLGILSKVELNTQIDGQINQVKTIGDYIYDALNDAINRKIDRVGRSELLNFIENYDPKLLFYPLPYSIDGRGLVARFIDLNAFLDKNAKENLKLVIGGHVEKGELVMALFELTDSDKTNIRLKEFRDYVTINLDEYKKIRDEILRLLENYDPKLLFYPLPNSADGRGLLARFIDLHSSLGKNAKENLKLAIDGYVENGDFVMALFELANFDKTNITQFRNYIITNLEEYKKIRDEILLLLESYDPKRLFYPLPNSVDRKGLLVRFIDLHSSLGKNAKENLKLAIDRYVENGDFAMALFELANSDKNAIEKFKNYIMAEIQNGQPMS